MSHEDVRERGRERARALQAEHAARGDQLGWFEVIYREGLNGQTVVPWADLAPNPFLVGWRARTRFDFREKACLTVGCGLGDDAEYLATAGGAVVAFDISPTAIKWCRNRFPASAVEYTAEDLFTAPPKWRRRFDFVVEANTLQALPANARKTAMERIAEWVAPAGTLLVICRGRTASDPPGNLPWPLTPDELRRFQDAGLREEAFDDLDPETPASRRFRIEYRRPAD